MQRTLYDVQQIVNGKLKVITKKKSYKQSRKSVNIVYQTVCI